MFGDALIESGIDPVEQGDHLQGRGLHTDLGEADNVGEEDGRRRKRLRRHAAALLQLGGDVPVFFCSGQNSIIL